jgi:hypothetical protein
MTFTARSGPEGSAMSKIRLSLVAAIGTNVTLGKVATILLTLLVPTVAVAKGESEIPQRMCDQISPLFANMGASRSRPISVTTSKVVCETFIGPDKARVTTNITKIDSH